METNPILSENQNIHYIHPITQNQEYSRFLSKLKIPTIVVENLYLFTVPIDKIQIYETHYKIIQEEDQYHPIPFSFNDFMLAYIAAENNFGIISLDHHLLSYIEYYLEYDCYWPSDIQYLPSDAILLLDTNILFRFLEKDQFLKNEILTMFTRSPNITFLISEPILDESKHVFYNKFSFHSDPEEIPHFTSQLGDREVPEVILNNFIDNFSHFASRKKDKQKMSKKNKKQKTDWNISPRFTHILD